MSLTRKIRRSKVAQKLTYDALNWITRNDDELKTLNCGIVPPNGFQLNEQLLNQALTQPGIELYNYVVQESGIDLTDKELLEIGCGRGGGTAHIADIYSPGHTHGIDFSNRSIQICRKCYPSKTLSLEVGEATDLPYSDDTFDAILSIETSHMIDDKHLFFSEAARVAKPGAVFMYLDFFYTKHSSFHSIDKIEEAIDHSSWVIESKSDLTPHVFKSLTHSAPMREAMIHTKCPKILQRQVHEFCMTRPSSAYRAFQDGRTLYFFYILKKEEVI